MEKRLTMILACLFLSLGMALAQTAVTGTVVSQEDGQPIIGATVRVVGASAGAVTDADGKFSISMPAGHNKLKVTYVGMVDQDVTVKGNSVRVVLVPDQTNLDEVMVVAYGTAKKSAFTGSAAVVKSDDIAKISSSNAMSALSGKVSGVQINSATGAPGQESFSIRIRGISSINAGNDPLIIVDGAPYNGDINNLNQNDIASMTVLKDAASAALYGARGANGVVIITTKNGREGTSSITVDAKWGANTRGVEFYNTVESPAGYYEAYYQSLKNYRTSLGDDAATAHRWALNNMFSGGYDLGYNVYTVPEGQDFIGPNGKLNPNATLGRVINVNGTEYLLYPDSWRDAAYQTGVRQEYNVTATGSNDKGSFYGSAGYLKNEGISIGSDYERFTGRLKADYQLRSWLKLSGNFNYAHYKANSLADDGGSTVGNVFMVKNMAPIYPLYIRDAAGNILQDSKTGLAMYDWGDGTVTGLTRPTMTGSNPIFANYFDKNQNEGNSLDATGTAEIRFLEDFKFTSANTVMLDETRFTYTNNPYYGQFAANNGSVQKAHVRTWAYNYQQLLNWHHLFDKHDVEVMLGHEYYRTRYYYLTASKNNMFSVFNDELAGAVNTGTMNSYTTDYNVEGWFGRVQYNYDNKYFGSLSYRRDASSRFHPDHRWGNFWSLGGAWIISKEKWFNAPWVDELKFKASYGEQGNDNIGSYLYTDTYSIVPSGDGAGVKPSSTKGNETITWEKNGNFNTGFEFSFFRGRLAGSIEYFYRRTSDMLAFFALPASSGWSGYYDNVGNMQNMGAEVELDGTLIRTKDFEWGLNLNFTAYKNEITSIADKNKTQTVEGSEGYASGSYFYGEGESLYTFYMPKYAGVDENGKSMFYKDKLDENGNIIGRETTTTPGEATYYLCGTALPWAYGGFGTRFSYKGFDLAVDFNYQLGGQIYDSDYAGMMGITSSGRGSAIHADLLNSWTEENPNTNIPKLIIDDTSTTTTSDRFLIGASYLSLQNLNFGYTFPTKMTSKVGIGKLRVYLTATNLWLWSKRQGLDPRQSITGGASSAYYSAMRTISGGISVTF
ncbi:SusC/RagA family TonB-linked outer membrane protein [Xylanibacter rarus]|uniref:Membrane protein n=2 Tax=Prevotellaceae TaxID=171552 RepID=A0A8E1QX25_9BACT|nr:TonB-dependent receptor [Xylanibacter rarus]KOO68326.1 membrane protein [Xylanibacter rarus]